MSAPAIAVSNLVKRFPLSRGIAEIVRQPFARCWTTALDGLDLEVGQGEIFGLLGSNGAGKTTLLKILCTLLLPTEGSAAVAGHDVVQAPASVRQAVGYCLDTERSFYFRLTGRQNLAFFAALNNLESRHATDRIAELTYSKGMQQKLGLIRALMSDPAVLLLDEPTKSLDPAAAAEFRRLVRNTLVDRFGKTILLVTHSLEDAAECCDRVALMSQGRISLRGTWAEVRGSVRNGGLPAQYSDSLS
jgi:ABC-2 type transport system ATP-binding protein